MFNEDKLREEIVQKWGPAGAHVEVFDMLRQDRDKLLEHLTGYVGEQGTSHFDGCPATCGHGERSCDCGAAYVAERYRKWHRRVEERPPQWDLRCGNLECGKLLYGPQAACTCEHPGVVHREK